MCAVYNYFHIIWTTFNNNQLHPKVDQIKKRQRVAQCILKGKFFFQLLLHHPHVSSIYAQALIVLTNSVKSSHGSWNILSFLLGVISGQRIFLYFLKSG